MRSTFRPTRHRCANIARALVLALVGLAGGCGERADIVLDFDRGGVSGNVNMWVCPAGSTSIDAACSQQQVFRDGDERGSSIVGIFVDDDSEAIDVYVAIPDVCRVVTLPIGDRLEIAVQLRADGIDADCDCTLEACPDGI